jgi:hypothetical protein
LRECSASILSMSCHKRPGAFCMPAPCVYGEYSSGICCTDLDNGTVAAQGLACLEHSAAPGRSRHLAPKADALTSAHSFGKGTLAETRRGLVLVSGTRSVAGLLCSSMAWSCIFQLACRQWLPVGGPRMRLKDFGPLTSSISPSRRASVQDSFALS